MRRRMKALGLATSLLLSGCVSALGTKPMGIQPNADDPGRIRWVTGPQPGIRTLLLEPIPFVVLTARDERRGPDLAVGAFYARWTLDGARLDELALMIQVTGPSAREKLPPSSQFLLEVDGVFLSGEIHDAENCYRVDETPLGPRVTVAIHIDPDRLQQLADARRVTGLLGPWSTFEIPAGVRARFEVFLNRIPEDNRLDWDRNVRAMVAALDR